MSPRPLSAISGRLPNYSLWSIEELVALATQLQIADARRKSRRELIDLFAPPAQRSLQP